MVQPGGTALARDLAKYQFFGQMSQLRIIIDVDVYHDCEFILLYGPALVAIKNVEQHLNLVGSAAIDEPC